MLSWREAWLHSEFRPSLDSREEEAETGGEGTAELGSLYIFSHHPLHSFILSTLFIIVVIISVYVHAQLSLHIYGG